MEERRKEARVRAELRVEVSGIDARSSGFRETVPATNLSRSGALLTNVHAELRCGDLLAIEFDGRHAYFRIVWVLESPGLEGMQVAIHKLSSQLCPWEEMLKTEAALATNLEGR
jgi:hypothetical protein